MVLQEHYYTLRLDFVKHETILLLKSGMLVFELLFHDKKFWITPLLGIYDNIIY